ncbi:MAG: hypothetical protein A3A58_01545 [Candidatus Blackburnbacteria bacterium RIFCSPLOWO2_01_FULL_41_27]|uniref:ISXO2-like transposase domain-containing protein n=2 Tax=Candidatus Blackburniibacteriota TaxID=1817898 RepID=A0A1G1VBN8_9BACT|nr:MAG: hypothetical protein A3F61_04550 [Candidatus Blackburnbacteria bacterium RIFCSPHIGHO2_12_FULL_41_13b]OGY14331.1 MAG: hypothetical protein A3A58_01545 [Candidatus Blackburnbacteria bacterium RIFCSPLOWO2_01_FULL_41_27]
MLIYQSKVSVLKRIRISDKKLRLIIRCFVFDYTASQASKLTQVNRNTLTRYYSWLRSLLLFQAAKERKVSQIQIENGIEIDESYFGPKRQKGKRGRGAAKKIIVLGLRKRGGKVYCQIIPDTTREEIMPIIRQTVKSGADIYTDGWRSYDALAIYGYNHKKVNHEKDEFVREGEIHINGVESFWSWTKRRLAKFNGIPKTLFPNCLLESEWRFNHRNDILNQMKQLIRHYKQSHSF